MTSRISRCSGAAGIATLLCILACTPPAADGPDAAEDQPAPDAGLRRDAGQPFHDAGTPPDAGPILVVDAGLPEVADAGAPFVDAGPADVPDAGPAVAVDAGTVVAADGPVSTSQPHWRLAFVDDFRGKQGQPDDAYCYDQLKPQCAVWAGGSNNCDLTDVSGDGFFPPTKENLTAAIRLFEPNHDFAAMSEADIKAVYGRIIDGRLHHLNKCTWTLYQMINWMATDYAGHWSARFDASQVAVDPAGKGYLQLSATAAPVLYDCAYGGTSFGGPNCLVYSAPAGLLKQGTTYKVDPNPSWPGIYYAAVGGQCPQGGVPFGPNCQVKTFAPHELEETGVTYWADADPRWPGVYYARQAYRCKENIDYSPSLGFRRLSCPILDGGMMSMISANRPWVDPATGASRARGQVRKYGRFEVKARLPKGLGAFPAAWMMPTEGGWPYKGGEIDILEARDNADEAYQTYHHGACYNAQTLARIDAEPGDCAAKGGVSTHLSKGYTTRQRQVDELNLRDHVYVAEWRPERIDYFINGFATGSITKGLTAVSDPAAPPSIGSLASSNFPTSPFYWILNHSTYVVPAAQAGFVKQTFLIDYVKSYGACELQSDFCPCGGLFSEGVGCTLLPREQLHCPAGVGSPALSNGVYSSECRPAQKTCFHGGTASGSRCLVKAFANGELRNGYPRYWVDADPRWPGVYYAKESGACPYGGSGSVNCQVYAFAADELETGVDYLVDRAATPVGVYYVDDFRP